MPVFLNIADYKNQAGLGRVPLKDEDDNKYLMPKWRAEAENVRHRYHFSPSPVLDQGGTSECVIYSCDKLLTTLPVVNKGFMSAERRTEVYGVVKTLDEWEGEDYDGTSVRAMMKWLHKQGFISRYDWAFELEPVIAHLLAVGPVALGTTWLMDMFTPTREGYLEAEGAFAGGHAYVAVGVNREKLNPDGTRGAVSCINSWGDKWGLKGRFWLTFRTLEMLIKDDGEACTPQELKVPQMLLAA